MADRKISDLTALTTPASGDYVPIVDISEAAAASKNKRITIQSLFQGIPVNVGIGTASPSAVLDVVSAAVGVAEFNGPANASIALNSDTVSLKLQCGGEAVFGSTTNHPTTFITNNTERLRIDSSGNVGIGTASPSSLLHLSDAGNIQVGTTTGTKIGTGTTQKIGFYNATPVVQPTAVADATDAATVITQLNALLTRMRNLGLIAT